MGSRPQGARRVEHLAVALQVDADFSGAAIWEGGADGRGGTVAQATAAVTAEEQTRLVPGPQTARPAAKGPRNQKPVFVLDRLPNLMGQTRRRDRPLVPALFQIGLPARVHLFMLPGQRFAAVLDDALGKFTLLFNLFGERRQEDSGVGDDRQIDRRQLLKIARPTPHDDIFE